MSEAPHGVDEPLLRRLSVAGLWLLVVNGMIGAGIFGLPAEAARLAGGLGPWLFVVCALLILPVMLVFTSWSSRFGNTGGPMLYAATAFCPMVGFQAGWAYYIARLTAFSANLSLLTLLKFLPLLATVALLYAGVQFASMAVLPTLAASNQPLVDVGAALLGPTGAWLVMAGVAVSVGGNLMGSMFSTPRVTYRLARDGNLPRWFGAVHPRFRTPRAVDHLLWSARLPARADERQLRLAGRAERGDPDPALPHVRRRVTAPGTTG